MTLLEVHVRLDERIRLMSALLAATDWPDRAQARKPHGCHPHARATRKHLSAHTGHPAVATLQGLLEKGMPLEALFTLAATLSWPDLTPARLPAWAPPQWPDQLRDFRASAGLERWYLNEAPAWRKSVSEASSVLADARFRTFLQPFFGSIDEQFVFVPNIGYPADVEVGVRAARELIAIIPPRLAWGDSPPWPYQDDPVYLHRAALARYSLLLLAPYLRKHAERLADAEKVALPVPEAFASTHRTWQAQFTSLFTSGLIAIYLEDHVSQAEARAYTLIERKAFGVALLPSIVSVLRYYLDGVAAGRYSELADFLPLFPKQVRVAKRIVSL